MVGPVASNAHKGLGRLRRLPLWSIRKAWQGRLRKTEGTCSLGVANWDGQEEAAGLVVRADRAPARSS